MNLSSAIKSKALEIGFSKIGIAKADFHKSDKLNLNSWIDKGYHASMQWIERRKEERANIKEYYPNAKSVISIAMNYFTGNSSDYFSNNKISNYAWGDDYHIVIKNKLYELLQYIKSIDNSVHGICCVDTSPVSEKVWAQRSGLGWIGKHTNLITRDFGTWVFLGEIILDVDLEYDQPFTKDLCGTCTLCIDACPTDALVNEYELDSNKCISYLTIEHRNEISEEFQDKMNDWIYGCDICQEACPWNKKFSIYSNQESFFPRDFLINNNADFLQSLSQEEYSKLFKNSSMKRTKISGLKRNINFINN